MTIARSPEIQQELDDGLIFVDNSKLSTFHKCPLQAYLQYVAGRTSLHVKHAPTVGTYIHEVLDRHFSGRSKDEAMEALNGYRELCEIDPPEKDQHSPEVIEHITSTWLDENPPDALPYLIQRESDVEAGFALPFFEHRGYTIMLYGRMDGIVQDRSSGERWVLEHKTTGWLTQSWLDQFEMSSQVSTYCWAAQEMTGRRYSGAIINAIEIKVPPGFLTKPTKCRLHPGRTTDECGASTPHLRHTMRPARRTPHEIAGWHSAAVALAKSYADMLIDEAVPEGIGIFWPETSCNWCDFKTFCRMGKPWEELPKLTKHHHWNPLA